MPEKSRYVGRPTKYGNPFQVVSNGNRQFRMALKIALGAFACESREEAIAKHREWIMRPEQARLRSEAREELAGKDLACWCGAGPCHADVLLEIANG